MNGQAKGRAKDGWIRGHGALLTATIFVAALASVSYADEDRCAELGASCWCSEPLNGPKSEYTRDSVFLNPGDSTTKQCTAEAGPGFSVAVNSNLDPVNDWDTGNDAGVLAKLPAGHGINYYLYNSDEDGSGRQYYAISVGARGFQAADFGGGRLATRFYAYHTADLETKTEGTCNNYKILHFRDAGRGGWPWPVDINLREDLFGAGGYKWHLYGWSSRRWKYNGDSQYIGECCLEGPPDPWVPGFEFRPTYFNDDVKGKWTRWEAVVDNIRSKGWRFRLYVKNVTDNTPERLVLDTGTTCSDGPFPQQCADMDDQMWLGATDVNPSAPGSEADPWDELKFEPWRGNGGCKGKVYMSHFIVAGWDTSAGQRIGAAYEIEGGTSPPGQPTNVTIEIQ